MLQKDEYWQGVRGIAVLAVVFIHCRNGLNYDGFQQYFWLAERSIVNFPVSVFLFMSGFFVRDARDLISCSGRKTFYYKKLRRVLLPYITWSILYSAIDIVASSISGHGSSFSKYFIDFFLGGAAPQLYYCVVLIQLITITPLLVRQIEREITSLFILCITPIYSLIMSMFAFKTGEPPHWYSIPFIAWISVYYLGILIKNKKLDELYNDTKRHLSFLIILGIGAQFIVSCMMKQFGVSLGYVVSQNKFTSILYSIIIIALFVRRTGWTFVSKFRKIGDYSYGIFLVHYVFIYGFKVMVISVNNRLINGLLMCLPIDQIVEMVIVLLLSILVIKMVKVITKGNNMISMLLGF